MSDKPHEPSTPPEELDPEAPPNLRLGLREKPAVQAALAKLGAGPGEDPLGQEVPEEPADEAEACGPEEARIYIGPTEPPRAHHKTLELARVKVRASALPAGSEERSRETVVSPRRAGRGGRGWGALAGAAVGMVVIGAVTLRGRGGGERAAGSASAVAVAASTASEAVACVVACAPSAAVSASAAATVSATAAVSASARAAPRVRATADASDPYGDAATPVVTAAATAEPAPAPVKLQPEDKPVF